MCTSVASDPGTPPSAWTRCDAISATRGSRGWAAPTRRASFTTGSTAPSSSSSSITSAASRSTTTSRRATTSTPSCARRTATTTARICSASTTSASTTRAVLAGERATLDGVPAALPRPQRRVHVYAAGSGPGALAAAGAVADGVFINYGLQAEHVARARGGVADGARAAGRTAGDLDEWWIACLDVSERRETALEKLGNILGFVAAYVVGPDPAGRGVPAELVSAVQEMRRSYTTRRAEMDPALLHRL